MRTVHSCGCSKARKAPWWGSSSSILGFRVSNISSWSSGLWGLPKWPKEYVGPWDQQSPITVVDSLQHRGCTRSRIVSLISWYVLAKDGDRVSWVLRCQIFGSAKTERSAQNSAFFHLGCAIRILRISFNKQLWKRSWSTPQLPPWSLCLVKVQHVCFPLLKNATISYNIHYKNWLSGEACGNVVVW